MTTRLRRIQIVLALATAVLMAGSAWAQWQALDFEQITVANTAIGFTTAKITPASGNPMNRATCYLETAEIRYTVNGTTPTSTVGMIWAVNTEKTLVGHDVLVAFRGIRDSGTSGQLDCTYSSGGSH